MTKNITDLANMKCMDILPTSIVSLGRKKLHLSTLTEDSGSGAVYACLGTVSKVGGRGIGLDSEVQDRADVAGSRM